VCSYSSRELAAAQELLAGDGLHPRRIQHGIPLGFSLILVFSSSMANVNAIRSTAFAIAPAATATRHKRPLSRSCRQHKE
jgi:ABC-type Mn2+/Zn2+ transport system permease subunit